MAHELQTPVEGPPTTPTCDHIETNVNISDSVGAIFLGVFAAILLGALLRAQGRNRKLVEKLAALQK